MGDFDKHKYPQRMGMIFLCGRSFLTIAPIQHDDFVYLGSFTYKVELAAIIILQ